MLYSENISCSTHFVATDVLYIVFKEAIVMFYNGLSLMIKFQTRFFSFLFFFSFRGVFCFFM